MLVRQSVIETGDTNVMPGAPRLYRFDLDWPDYYNSTTTSPVSTESDTTTTSISPLHTARWSYPVVFLVQLRLHRNSPGSMLEDENDPELLDESGYTEWRSLVWVSFPVIMLFFPFDED